MAKKLRFFGMIDDDELLLLSQMINANIKIDKCNPFKLDDISDKECKILFRFEKHDIPRLQTALRIPNKVICRNGTVCTGLEGLCILLRRLCYPNRLHDLNPIFRRPDYELSYIVNEVISLIYEEHGYLLRNLDHHWLNNDHLYTYSQAILNKEAPLGNCWGFIDGTCRPICKPIHNQRTLYSGHKRTHGIKFQSVTTPNGMIVNLYGPVEGSRHDAAILRMSGLLVQLQRINTNAGNIYSLYGDPAYPLRPELITPFRGAALTPEEQMFNKKMSAVRISVEWIFGKIVSLFAFLDFKKNIKLYLQPVAKYYYIGAILTNCHTCLYGSETGSYFGVEPPSLEEYLQQ